MIPFGLDRQPDEYLCCCCWKSRMKESNLALGSLATRHVGLSVLRAMGLLLHLDLGLSAYLEPQAQRHEPVWTKTTNTSTNINVNILVQIQLQIQNKSSRYIWTRACQHISSPKLKDMSPQCWTKPPSAYFQASGLVNDQCSSQIWASFCKFNWWAFFIHTILYYWFHWWSKCEWYKNDVEWFSPRLKRPSQYPYRTIATITLKYIIVTIAANVLQC